MESTPKHFALQFAVLVSLYVSIAAILTLLMGIITLQFPDAAQASWEYESASSSVRYGIALLIVFFPTYVALSRYVNRARRSGTVAYHAITRWLVYLSLVIGGGILLGDLVTVINSFLNGDITIRFILKALAFFVVVGAASYYYALDAKDYWQTHEKQSIQYAQITSVVVIATLVAGFLFVETPAEVHEMRLDESQIGDLVLIQSHVEQYYILHSNTLPGTLDDIYKGTGWKMPVAGEGREAYTYRRVKDTEFELCASFGFPSNRTDSFGGTYAMQKGVIQNPDMWEHSEGRSCFTRIVAPVVSPN